MKPSICALLFLCTIGCQPVKKDRLQQAKDVKKQVSDTLVDSRILTDNIAGSIYIERAIGYSLVVANDTSDYMPILSESKSDKNVSLDLNIPYNNNSTTHRQRFVELEKVIAAARKDFNFDSLNSISVGRLIQTGDLAVEISKQYQEIYGNHFKVKISDYEQISQFLLQSKLAADFNLLLEPYSISVAEIQIEKAFFTTSDNLFKMSKLETDSILVPEKILDCIVWIKLRKL